MPFLCVCVGGGGVWGGEAGGNLGPCYLAR